MALITTPARKTRKLTHNATHHEHKIHNSEAKSLGRCTVQTQAEAQFVRGVVCLEMVLSLRGAIEKFLQLPILVNQMVKINYYYYPLKMMIAYSVYDVIVTSL